MKLNIYQKVCLGFFIALVVFWFVLFILGIKEGFYNYLFSFLFGVIPLVAGVIAVYRTSFWGGLKTVVGKAIFFIGLGLFCWGVGETIWSYYNFFMNIPAPYPSIADLGFAPSIFFYGLGIFYLSKVSGATLGIKKKHAKTFVALGIIVLLFVSYYFLVTVARGGVIFPEGETTLKAILDLAYPLGDFIGLILGVIISGLSFGYLGGKYKFEISSILLGIGIMFVADVIFPYTITLNTYYNADFGDLMLALGMFLLSFGILGFYNLKED